MQAVFQVSPANRRGTFWPERYSIATPVFKGIHFLLYNIRLFTHTAGKETGVLEGWGINALVAIELTDISRLLPYIVPVGLLFG